MPRPTNAGIAAAGRAVRAWRGAELQEDVAKRAGIGPDTLGDLEAGNRWPRNKTLRAIEGAFGRKPGELDEIAAGAEEPELPTAAELEDLREHVREVLGDEAGPFLEALDAAVTGAPLRRRGGAAAGRSAGRLRAAGQSL